MAPHLLTGATVLACDPATGDSLRGDVLIRDGRIESVQTSITPPSGCVVHDLSGLILFPGLVDAHQHVWESPYLLERPDMSLATYFADFVPDAAGAVTPESLHEATSVGLAQAVRSGTTTTVDWCHVTNTPDHARAAISAAKESGSRYLFAYGPPVALGYYRSERPHPQDLETLAGEHSAGPDDLVGLVAALRGPDLSPMKTVVDDITRARRAGLRISMHVSTHLSGAGGVTSLDSQGLLGDDVQLVHLTDATPTELEIVADTGTRVVVPPVAELSMGTGLPPFRALVDAGIRAGLGVDTVLGSPPDMFSQMRAAALLLRAGPWSDREPPLGSSIRDVLRAATIDSARACWLEDSVGSVSPGKWADLVAMRPSRPVSTINEAYAQVVWQGDPGRLESVLVAGHEMLARPTPLTSTSSPHPGKAEPS